MSSESDLEEIAFAEDWQLNNLDSLAASIKSVQDKIDSLIAKLPQKWTGDTSQVAVARLRVHKTNHGKIRTALNQGKALITGSSEEACIANSANQVRKEEAQRLLSELPGGVIPPQVHDAVNRGLKIDVPGFGKVDVNTQLSNLSNFFGAKRDEHAEKALVELQKLARDEADKFNPLEKIDYDPLPTEVPDGGGDNGGGWDPGKKSYGVNYSGPGYTGGPTGPGGGGNGDGGSGGNRGNDGNNGGGNDQDIAKRLVCGVCSCSNHSEGCGCVSRHPVYNGACGYGSCLCTSHSGSGCWCIPRHTTAKGACGYGSCRCMSHSGLSCWCVASHVTDNTGGGNGNGGRPGGGNNYGNPSVDSRLDGSVARNGLGAAGLGAAGLAAGAKLAGGGGLGAGLAGGLGAGGIGGAVGAGGAARGGSGLQGSAAAAGKGGAAGAGSGAASGSGSKGAGRSGMMMGGQGGGAADKKNAKRSGLGYVAPKIEDEGDGGPAAAASRAGSREP
ncbi:hypothetical protein G7066_13530 [Leucobacter coleopterorum]|uniref:PPE family protein n=1 Tax=Leucobacter coleopterorum TaxID=2714933 RepID=A0ABX6JYM1_9MICO|nr:hypothetical protein [Leucobacter coleopterorum]QIM19337.1 hypothetical protein G7066_13530 [Leucobacter coleopterorum]